MLLGRKWGFLILGIVTSVFAIMPMSVVEKSWLRLCKLSFFVWLTGLFFSSLLPLPYLEPVANMLLRLSNVRCGRQSWDLAFPPHLCITQSYLCVIRFLQFP